MNLIFFKRFYKLELITGSLVITIWCLKDFQMRFKLLFLILLFSYLILNLQP